MRPTPPLRQVLILLILILGAAFTAWQGGPALQPPPSSQQQGDLDAAYQSRTSGQIAEVTAEVHKVLPDDRDGSRHQRFLIKLPSGLSVLVAHNIDLAPRVPDLQAGTPITIRGQYEWNDRGGVLHWTHHDPRGRHEPGWIDYAGQRYE